MATIVRAEAAALIGTADQLEQTFDSVKMENGGKKDGDILNAFLGTAELHRMGQHLLAHMRDEDRWGSTSMVFEPIDFTTAAFEVAHDQTLGQPEKTAVHFEEQLPPQVTFELFTHFWLPRIAATAYGQEYGAEVRAIVEAVQD